jgi:glycosyltransferase involved in cell wall biosynthesis
MKSAYQVAIVSKFITDYRVRFLDLLKERLARSNIELILLYGQPTSTDALKFSKIDIPWGKYIANREFSLGRMNLLWQPVLSELKDSDLIIIEQASRLLVNYPLLLQNALGLKKVAFWGHGRNFQEETRNLLSEWIKKNYSTQVHWWFAYNQTSLEVVHKLGFPKERITNVQNAIDTRDLIAARAAITNADLEITRKTWNIQGHHLAIYVGGMYLEKRIDFLLKACQIIRHQIPDFEMVFIGTGPDANLVIEAAKKYPWIYFLGPLYGRDRVPFFCLSDAFLMPGLVGLAILDCFALNTPMITTYHKNHSPEIEYLVHGVNGLIVDAYHDESAYAQHVSAYMENKNLQNQLKQGCERSATQYTIEEMANRFADGIERALEFD